MLRQVFLFFSMLFIGFSCTKEKIENAISDQMQSHLFLSRDQINAQVDHLLQTHQKFEWSMVDAQTLWSANLLGDTIVNIGYQPAGEKQVNHRLHEIDIHSKPWLEARAKLLDFILVEIHKHNPGKTFSAKDLMPFAEEEVLPIINIKIWDLVIIKSLRQRPDVRYIEPMGYAYEEVEVRSGSGCDASPEPGIPSADYSAISPGAVQSWHHAPARVSTAWTNNSGSGITVALLDTGTPNPANQPKLGSQFNSGLSLGRTLTRLGTYVSCWFCGQPDGPDDQCGHGTMMAGLIAAPRGYNNTPAGIAYNSNLLSIRVSSDVVLNGSSEKKGLADGLVIAGNHSGVKVISVSLGYIFSSGQVEDGIRYAYGKGKMILAAAGTSTSITNWYGVIFPAWMPECVAVTGVKDGGLPLERCNVCHSGSKVDFVAVMQRKSDNNRTAVTLASTGNVPTTVGGSSAATATTAGIAALIWATNPAQTRAQVFNRMKAAATWPTSKNGELGYGMVDVGKAVTGG